MDPTQHTLYDQQYDAGQCLDCRSLGCMTCDHTGEMPDELAAMTFREPTAAPPAAIDAMDKFIAVELF